jgi:hypothetical protein
MLNGKIFFSFNSAFGQKNFINFSDHPDTLREAYIIDLFGAKFNIQHWL